jgi:hypothetical protein
MKSKVMRRQQRIALASQVLVTFAVRVVLKNNRRRYEPIPCPN